MDPSRSDLEKDLDAGWTVSFAAATEEHLS